MEDIPKTTANKGYIYSKGLLVQIKEEKVFKIITKKAFTDDEDSLKK